MKIGAGWRGIEGVRGGGGGRRAAGVGGRRAEGCGRRGASRPARDPTGVFVGLQFLRFYGALCHGGLIS